MSAKVEKIKKETSIPAGQLDDVIKDFLVVQGALTTLSGTFDVDVGGYWGLHAKLQVLETVLDLQANNLQKGIEELCRLAGRPVYPEGEII
jgi:hypothetical protein